MKLCEQNFIESTSYVLGSLWRFRKSLDVPFPKRKTIEDWISPSLYPTHLRFSHYLEKGRSD